MPEDARKPWTDAETERFFSCLGKYLVAFQWVEGQLDQIILLYRGHENWAQTQEELANLRLHRKIQIVHESLSSPVFNLREVGDWLDRGEKLLNELDAERRRRNDLVHAQYLFEFVEAGMPPVQSNRRKGDERFFQQDIDLNEFERRLRSLAELGIHISLLRTQMIHRLPRDESSGSSGRAAT